MLVLPIFFSVQFQYAVWMLFFFNEKNIFKELIETKYHFLMCTLASDVSPLCIIKTSLTK